MRRWLTLLVTATTSLVLLALMVPLASLVGSVAENGALTEATGAAEFVARAASESDPRALEPIIEGATAAWGHSITVYLADGRRLGSPQPQSAAVRLAASHGRSVTARAPGGSEVLVAVQSAGQGMMVVRVFLSDAARTRGVAPVWAGMLVLGLVLIGLGMLVADRLARAITRPMATLARVSDLVAGGDVTARAVPDGPREVRSAADALNHLAGRIDELLIQERETVADISHRLRTPLTSLRLEAESLRAPGEAARIEARVGALQGAVTAIINEARQRTRERASCDAADVIAARVRFWSALAEDQGRAIRVDLAPGPLLVPVGEPELAACVDALLENVFDHTGVPFSVRLEPAAAGIRFTVAVPELHNDPARALDLARHTAESAGGSLLLVGARDGGAHVVLVLPRHLAAT
ncbi:HAMP domain-containing sensor histidine kinase [Nonomuraea sp. NPDC050404]|uniref:sensor histidine kinase n=1 Tax=Nonomuraea sp. NPDC050404 TaxID=3155783 RepID=UPI0033C046EE